MKRSYETPKFEIISFSDADAVTTASEVKIPIEDLEDPIDNLNK